MRLFTRKTTAEDDAGVVPALPAYFTFKPLNFNIILLFFTKVL